MAEVHLQLFVEKVRQLNAFVALSEADPLLRQELIACDHHDQVVALARRCGFEIARRWGELPAAPADIPPLPPAVPPSVAATASTAPGNPAASRSLLADPCPPPGQERTQVLLEEAGLRLERIHSCDAVSPPGFWYEQEEHEWVLLLQGSARLAFEDEAQERGLAAGDSVLIRAGRRHRVTATDPAPGTVWLALFWSTAAPPAGLMEPPAPASRPQPG